MTDIDLKFVRELAAYHSLVRGDTSKQQRDDYNRLISLLGAETARGNKAEFFSIHQQRGKQRVTPYCSECKSQQASHQDEKHFWTDADWLKEADKKVRGE